MAGEERNGWVELARLRPTQITVGLRYVRAKVLITLRNGSRREEFMREHPVKLALGPADTCYVLDHHHWALAWELAGESSAPATVVADYRHLSAEKFWSVMSDRRFVHPFSETGGRRPVSDLPLKLGEMRDDPYQSLAALARRAGAYRKPGKAESTFVWADFFRERIALDDGSDEAFVLALASAVRWARSRRARKLPGFIG